MNIALGTVATPSNSVANRVLVVDDDADIRRMIHKSLDIEGFAVTEAGTLYEAREILDREAFDVALVDITLGDEDGLTLVRALSSRHDMSLIVISGRDDEATRVLGIEIGADDFISKPFRMRELTARIRRRCDRLTAIRQRSEPSKTPLSEKLAGVVVDMVGHRIEMPSGEMVDLSESEFSVLRVLLDNRGAILSRDDIHKHIFGYERDPLDRRIDAHVSHIRKKLALKNDSVIRTVHRAGYVLE